MSEEDPYKSLSGDESLKKLNSNADQGLSSDEAKKRLEKNGFNELKEVKTSTFKRILSFFWGPIPWMIEIAAILSLILERWPDLIMIVSLLLINAILGFFQEYKAQNAMDALKQKLALKAQVKREGKWVEIPAKELVPGDIVFMKLGAIVPADMKLIQGEYMTVDQSALTGESLPVEKKVNDIAFSGTVVKLGEMTGVVTSTGVNTFFGKTAMLTSQAKNVSHFQKAVIRIGHFLIYLTISIALVLFFIDLFRSHYFQTESFSGLFIFLLVLLIAGIPVALPAVLSMTMAVGANKMAKLKAIVSKLTSIEELASMDVLCSDKTGTLTKNVLTLGEIQTFSSHSAEEVLTFAALACEPKAKDAIDLAITNAIQDPSKLQGYKVTKFTPFDPVHKKAEATLEQEGKSFVIAKGAPQIILQQCNLSQEIQEKAQKATEELASTGYRTLGVAKQENGAWEFLGLLPLFDPPRDDTAETLQNLTAMGIKVKMVTGDHIAIAKEMAKKLNMGQNILSATQIDQSQDKGAAIDGADGFAEFFPQHKFEIVKRLQSAKKTVGMTGDGVNDAPALKQADIGIAVGGATDAARAAADLILTEKGLLVIKTAVEEARRIFGRMTSYAMYRISETCRLLFFLLLASVFFKNHPLSAIQVILIALLNDIPIMMIAYDKMKLTEKPVSWNMKEVLTVAIGLAVVGVISTFGLYWLGITYFGFNSLQGRTLAFLALLCGGNLTIYLTRNREGVFSKPLPETRFFLATLLSQIAGTLISVYGIEGNFFVGIGWKWVGLSWVYIAVWFGICYLVKRFLFTILNRKKPQEGKEDDSQISGG